MPIAFQTFCTLLSNLEKIALQDPPLLPLVAKKRNQDEVVGWFRNHRTSIDSPDTDGNALLSALFPERRTDRVYLLQPPKLALILARCFCLGSSRIGQLKQWDIPGRGDLGLCVQRILIETPFEVQPQNVVTLEEIDAVLDKIASGVKFSGPQVKARKPACSPISVDNELQNIYCRLAPQEAKWFTRMILKDYVTVSLPWYLTLRSFHYLLPMMLKCHDSFEAVVALLRGPTLSQIPATPRLPWTGSKEDDVARMISPTVGDKVGRPLYYKARSVKHIIQMAQHRRMSLERKYDGEYCQIHVDLRKSGNEIQIFSKSGKDSTIDKEEIHESIKHCLSVGKRGSSLKSQCILEGELVVWDDETETIAGFHKLRKHISRSGSFIGKSRGSQVHHSEHLMIVLYDLLLLDDIPITHESYERRRRRLESLVTVIPGFVQLAIRKVIDFSTRKAPQELMEALATAFMQKWEGYVLKPCNEPYLNFKPRIDGASPGAWIKIKKDYISGLGDNADLAIMGGAYDAVEAAKAGSSHLRWTHFYVGTLKNKKDVLRRGAKPELYIIDSVKDGISKKDLQKLSDLGNLCALEVQSAEARDTFDFHSLMPQKSKMTHVFKKPFVIEVKGLGFEKPPGCDHLAIRFPMVVKIHWDRGLNDTVGFEELQSIAKNAMDPVNVAELDLVKEVNEWIDKLMKSERGKKGQKTSWEDSQGCDGDSGTECPPSLISSPKAVHNKSYSSTRQASSVSTAVDTSTIYSSISSPKAASDPKQTQNPLPPEQLSPEVCRKRPAERLEDELTSGTSKVRCTDILDEKENQLHNGLGHSTPQGGSLPLKEVFNSSQQLRQLHEIMNATKSQAEVSPPGLKLLRKISVGTNMIRPKRKGRAKVLVDDSPTTTVATSKRTTDTAPSITASVQPPSQSKSKKPTPVVQESTVKPYKKDSPRRSAPLSTTAVQTATPTFPQFSECTTILSPCITHMPYLTENLLPAQQAKFIASKRRLTRSACPSTESKCILLVESRRNQETANFLIDMTTMLVEMEHEAEIWDWRVLERMGGQKDAKKAGSSFMGWLRRNEEAGQMQMVWKDGCVSWAGELPTNDGKWMYDPAGPVM